METWKHFLSSSVLAVALYPLFSWGALLVIAGGVLIDIDHYLWYTLKYNNISLFKAYKFYAKNLETNDFSDVEGILLIFHTIEFLLLAALLSFYSSFALMFLIGLLGHYLLDLIFLWRITKRFLTAHSILLWIFKKNEKNSK